MAIFIYFTLIYTFIALLFFEFLSKINVYFYILFVLILLISGNKKESHIETLYFQQSKLLLFGWSFP
jgi:hypothetical protein